LGLSNEHVLLPLLPHEPLPEDEIEQWVSEMMPEQFLCMNHPFHSNYSPACVLEWIQSRPFLDCQTMVDMGGPGGIRYAIFLLLRMFIQATDLPVVGNSKFKVGFVNTVTITAYSKIAIQIITSHLTDSATILKTTRDARRLSANQELAFEQLPQPKLAQLERPISPLHPDDKTISSRVAPSTALVGPDFASLEDSRMASVMHANVHMEDSPVLTTNPKAPQTPKKVGSGLLGQELAEATCSPRHSISAPSLWDSNSSNHVGFPSNPLRGLITLTHVLGGLLKVTRFGRSMYKNICDYIRSTKIK
jgi:hypothetical protein